MNVNSEECQKELNDILNNYIANLKEEVEYRFKKWKFVRKDRIYYNVIQGLLARQTSIVADLIKIPIVWNENILPSVLRSMIDLYINMAWILKKDSNQRAEKYIEYGLGQEKIFKEYRIEELKSQGIDPNEDLVVKSSDVLINGTLKDELLNINLGSWSELTVRKMAMEAGCIDFYNLTYIPFSISAHNSWTHLMRFNLKTCENPLHGYHFIGKIHDKDASFIHYLRIITKYMKKTLDLFDSAITLDLSNTNNSYKILWDKLNSLCSMLDE